MILLLVHINSYLPHDKCMCIKENNTIPPLPFPISIIQAIIQDITITITNPSTLPGVMGALH